MIWWYFAEHFYIKSAVQPLPSLYSSHSQTVYSFIYSLSLCLKCESGGFPLKLCWIGRGQRVERKTDNCPIYFSLYSVLMARVSAEGGPLYRRRLWLKLWVFYMNNSKIRRLKCCLINKWTFFSVPEPRDLKILKKEKVVPPRSFFNLRLHTSLLILCITPQKIPKLCFQGNLCLLKRGRTPVSARWAPRWKAA